MIEQFLKIAVFSFAAVSGVFSVCISAEELPPLSEPEKKLMKGIGAKLDKDGNICLAEAIIDRRTKNISFDGKLNIREGSIEVIVSTAKGRTHESLIVTELDPFKLQLALILAGYRNGPILEDAPIPMGSLFDIEIVYDGGKKRVNVDDWLINMRTGKPKDRDGYVFVGSNFQGSSCLASVEGNLINLNSNDENTIVNAKLNAENINDQYDTIASKIPDYEIKDKDNPKPEDYIIPVTVILKPRAAKTVSPAKPEGD